MICCPSRGSADLETWSGCAVECAQTQLVARTRVHGAVTQDDLAQLVGMQGWCVYVNVKQDKRK